jgi:hypothetical protein
MMIWHFIPMTERRAYPHAITPLRTERSFDEENIHSGSR